MRMMYNFYLTSLHTLAFFLPNVVGQAPSLSPTVNGPRSPAGRDDHSHDREPVSRIPTTPPPSKTLSVITSTPVAQPIPNPPRPPTTNRRHRGPTDPPLDLLTPKPSSPPTPFPTAAPTIPPPCPALCRTNIYFAFYATGSQSGTFDASCLSTSAPVAVKECNLDVVQASFFRTYVEPFCTVTVSLSGATFVPSFYAFGVIFLTQCPGRDCQPSDSGIQQGGTTVTWFSDYWYYVDILMVPVSGTPSPYTLHISCL